MRIELREKPNLPADVVDYVEADERGEGERDDDGRGVDVEAELAIVCGGSAGFQGDLLRG
jgi:hypothetical protein